jgi:hypothetical protein
MALGRHSVKYIEYSKLGRKESLSLFITNVHYLNLHLFIHYFCVYLQIRISSFDFHVFVRFIC